MPEEASRQPPFAGVEAPNTTPVPDDYFDLLIPRLGKASLKVLLYLTRRIFGFKKEGDTVSLSQIRAGIRKRDGAILDRGTGLSRHAAARAIRDLEAMGVITATRGVSDEGDPSPTYYQLRFRDALSVHDLLRPRGASEAGYRFPGIDSPNTTPVPDIYFDYLLPDLGLAEWRVLLYVVRRTLGFKKLSDAISLDQFTEGIVTRDGAKLDGGTGLSRSNVHEALNQLVMRNVLVRQRVRGPRTGDGISIYGLAMRDEVRRTMGSTLGMVPGPLREATTDSPLATGGLQPTYTGVRPDDHQGVPQGDYQGVLPSDYPGVPRSDRPLEARLSMPRDGVPANDYQGVLPMPYPGVPEPDRPESFKATHRGTGKRPPVGSSQSPQQTDPQQTAEQKGRRDADSNVYLSLIERIGLDLGTADGGELYAARVNALAKECGLPESDFHGAIAAAWKTTRAKLDQGALDRPDAALAYFFTVLTDRVAPRPRVAPPPAAPGPALQDGQFIEQARQRLRQVGDQTAWVGILRGLAESMTRANYTRWFARSVALDDPDSLLIVVADPLQRDWLSRRLHEVVRREGLARGEQRPIRFVTLEDAGNE